MTLSTKRQFLSAWEAGCLGNRLRVWRSAADALASGAPRVGFRELGRTSGLHEIVDRAVIKRTADQWVAAGRAFYLDEAAPDERNVLQGEIGRTVRGLEGYLGVRTGVRMRHAMAAGLLKPVTGSTILALCDRFLDPSSRDDLEALLDLFDDHVIEFSAYDRDLGVIPGRNMVVWEVRRY